MDFDFKSSKTSKYEKEQQKRREELLKRKEQEERRAKEYQKRMEELAEQNRLRKEEEERKLLEEEALKNDINILTGGIRFSKCLSPYLLPDNEDDKIILPEDCLDELNSSSAFDSQYPIIFRISKQPNTIAQLHNNEGDEPLTYSHCGLREFTAPSGKVGITPKLLKSLKLTDEELAGNNSKLFIDYIRLSKCTYVKFEPQFHDFFQVEYLKLCLEENLRICSTITKGDIFPIKYRGQEYLLKVIDLKPEKSCSLFNTDVEVDLDNSAEYKEKEAQKVVPSISTSVENSVPSSIGRVLGRSEPSHPLTSSSSSLTTTAMDVDTPTFDLPEFELLPEPEKASPFPSFISKIKLPTGKSITRKFSHSSPLLQMFLWVMKELNLTSKELFNQQIQISTRSPPRNWILTRDTWLSFANESFLVAGLLEDVTQELFFVSIQPY